MKLGSTLIPFGMAVLLIACGGSDAPKADTPQKAETTTTTAAATPSAEPAGFYTNDMIDPPVGGDIDQGLVDDAMKIFNAKCKACHGLTEEKVVGPGWKGIYSDEKAAWIMNMMLHTDWMLENDAEAQALVEETKTVMPDQELSEKQARAMLELIRSL